MPTNIDPLENEGAGASAEGTGSGLKADAFTSGGSVNHRRVRLPLGARPRAEGFPYGEIDRRNGWEQSAAEIARVGAIGESHAAEEAKSSARDAIGLSEFLRVINDHVTSRGRVADAHQRFLNFEAACWVINAPWLEGRGLREMSESLNVSHETFRQRATRIAADLQLRMKTISPEHKQALHAAIDRRAQQKSNPEIVSPDASSRI
jgi:hypothetical protein